MAPALHLLLVLLSALASDAPCPSFRSIATDSFDTSGAELVGRLDSPRCAQRCANNCSAFFVTNDFRCFLLARLPTSKREIAFGGNRVMVSVDSLGNWTRKCSHKDFPEVRGLSRYRVERLRRQWAAAANFCVSLGGKLLQISTEAERVYVWHIMKMHRLTDQFTFIGLFKDPAEKVQELTDGWRWHGTLDKMEAKAWWHRGEPNNHLNAEFVGAWYPRSGFFNDEKMNKTLSFVCECRDL